MFKGNNNFIVGLFLSISLAAFIGFILWLTGRSGVEEMRYYSMMFKRDVSGLSIGGPVNYMGVNIGSVTGMQLVRKEDMNVQVDIEVLASTPVDNGTFASLALQGITGVAVINLSSDPGAHQPLAREPGNDYPLIPVRDVGFAALLSSAPQIIIKMDDLLTRTNELLSEENRAAFTSTLENIQTLAASLAQSRALIAGLPSDMERTLAEIRDTVEQLQGIIKGAGPGLTSSIDNIEVSSQKLASLTSRLDNWMAENEVAMQHFVAEGLGEAPELVRNARQAIRQLEKLVQELQDSPSQLIHRVPEDALEIEP